MNSFNPSKERELWMTVGILKFVKDKEYIYQAEILYVALKNAANSIASSYNLLPPPMPTVKPQTTQADQKIIDEGISNEIEDKKLQEKQ